MRGLWWLYTRRPKRVRALARYWHYPSIMRKQLREAGEWMQDDYFWQPGELYARPISYRKRIKETGRHS